MFHQLQEALEEEDVDRVRRMLAEGADPNETDEIGYGPMHDWHKVEMYCLLVEAGGDVNTVSGGRTRALAECASMGDIPGVSYLLSVGAKADLGNLPAFDGLALHMAVASDAIEVVKLLLDTGADINLQDADAWTCLWWLKSVEVATFLLGRGADPSISGERNLPENDESMPEPVRAILRKHRIAAAKRTSLQEPKE